nr:hypothetical protein GCM10020093_054350 [Planobispora longispora]
MTVYTRRDSAEQDTEVAFAPGVTVVHVPAGPPESIPKDDLLAWMPDFSRWIARRWAASAPDIAHSHFWMSGLAALAAARATGVPVVHTFHALGTVKRRHQGSADTSPRERVETETVIAWQADAVIATCSDEVAELNRLRVPGGPPTSSPAAWTWPRSLPRARRRTSDPARSCSPSAGRSRVRAWRPSSARSAGCRTPRWWSRAASPGTGDRPPGADRGRVRRRRPGPVHREGGALRGPRPDAGGDRGDQRAVVRAVRNRAAGGHGLRGAGGRLGGGRASGHRRPGVTGVLVPPRREAVLAGALRGLLADPPLLAAYGAAAVERAASRYSWERVAAETSAVYAEVLASRSRTARITAAARHPREMSRPRETSGRAHPAVAVRSPGEAGSAVTVRSLDEGSVPRSGRSLP